jgi:hypothetical protein
MSGIQGAQGDQRRLYRSCFGKCPPAFQTEIEFHAEQFTQEDICIGWTSSARKLFDLYGTGTEDRGLFKIGIHHLHRMLLPQPYSELPRFSKRH